MTATIDHVHRDGLYAQLNSMVRCRISARTKQAQSTDGPVLEVRLIDRGRALAATAMNPVAQSLLELPSACPGQGDSLDGLADDYLGPGFSFAVSWGADRWFTSATAVVPLSRLRPGARLRLPVGLTQRGSPPPGCAVRYAYEHCTTGGAWSGTVTLTARG